MIIGKFKAEGDGYTGELFAVGLEIELMEFQPAADKQGDDPDFNVIGYGDAPDPMGPPHFDPDKPIMNPYKIGKAWKKISKTGKPYLSVQLDGPTLAAPIHCTLTERKDGSYRLNWSREDDEAAAEQAAA